MQWTSFPPFYNPDLGDIIVIHQDEFFVDHYV